MEWPVQSEWRSGRSCTEREERRSIRGSRGRETEGKGGMGSVCRRQEKGKEMEGLEKGENGTEKWDLVCVWVKVKLMRK